MLPHFDRPAFAARRWREMALGLASVGLCLLVLAGLEAAARRAAAEPGEDVEDVYTGHDYSETLGWVPRAGAHFHVYGAPTSINAEAYRGRLVPGRRAGGPVRVVHLGDSVAFGYGVSDEQTFAHLLDPTGQRYESLNLAVPGYGVDQSVLRFERLGRGYAPDVVVLSLCVDNDLADVMLSVFLYDGQHPKPYFRLEHDGLVLYDQHLRLSPAARWGLWLRGRSALARRVARWQPRQGPQAEPEHWTIRRQRAQADRAAAVDLLTALIARLRQDVEACGARLLVLVHPNKATYRRAAGWVEALARQAPLAGLQFVDVGQAYRDEGLGFGRVTLDGVGHLNEAGHRLAARALRDVLDADLPRPAAP